MSFNFYGHFRDKQSAMDAIETDPNLPNSVRVFLQDGVSNLPDDDRSIIVSAGGHLCSGKGSYEVSAASLSVRPSNPLA